MENLSLLVQVPLIGSFIFFVLRNNAEWRAFLKEQNEGFIKTLDKNAVVVEKLSEVMHSLDKNISSVRESQAYVASALDRNTQLLGERVRVNGESKKIIDLIYDIKQKHKKGGDIYE